jgi:hypothetical protein
MLFLLLLSSMALCQDSIFLNNLPTLTKDQIALYRKVWPAISEFLENPNNFFVSSMTQLNDTTEVKLLHIYALRKFNGTVSVNGQKYRVLRFNDERYPHRFLFDSAGEIISCTDSYGDPCSRRKQSKSN